MNNISGSINDLLKKTMEYGATDLHLCAGSKPLVRINSKLTPIEGTEKLRPGDINKIIDHYLDESRRSELVENKVIDFSYSIEKLGRFRCNIYRQRGTYAMAVRALPLEIPKFETLGLPDIIKEFTKKSKGLVLVAGATGSGKSTTLASLIDIINEKYNYHVITIEDPLEYLHKHKKSMITQREIGEDAHSFASALKAALREDPDVIMVGEMRDMETISIALSAAETGHLVLSTLHTIGAVKSIDRILDSFPTDQQNQVRSQLSTVLEGVVSQQLLPHKNGKDLVAASEVMVVTPAVRNLIRESKYYQINNLIQSGVNDGMRSLERNLAKLCKEGIIEEKEAHLKTQDIQLFNRYMSMDKI
ncbi:MAG: type IV pilus twitching motility protein PilT [Clostridiales bacterium]|nr:type IV pilus twitching motility protein PilT [Clostridiales bacterium]